jgi:PAS domain-containing protein
MAKENHLEEALRRSEERYQSLLNSIGEALVVRTLKRSLLPFTDISESKRTENHLRTNEEKLRLIVENAREHAIFSTDLERRITSWNSGAQQLLSYTE